MVESKEFDNENIFMKIRRNLDVFLDDYYHTYLAMTVFAVGAFVFYIYNGISRGLFLLIDLFFIYKCTRNFIEFRKLKNDVNADLEKKIRLLYSSIAFCSIAVSEGIVRHFLDLNIIITKYLVIMVFVYFIGFIIYKILESYNKKFYFNSIDENCYEKVINYRVLKHKLFIITSFFMFVFSVIVMFMHIITGDKVLIVATIFLSVVLVVSMDSKSDILTELNYLDREGFFAFSKNYKVEMNNEMDEDYEELDDDINSDFKDEDYEEELDDDFDFDDFDFEDDDLEDEKISFDTDVFNNFNLGNTKS